MTKLNLPEVNLSIRKKNGVEEVFDVFRNKYVKITPEEWVRQNFLIFLVNDLAYRKNLIAVEKAIDVNGMQRRFDAVVYIDSYSPIMLLEFKAPEVKITQNVFDQIVSYNQRLKVPYLIISNGLQHYCMKYNGEKFDFLNKLPKFGELG